MSSLSGEVCKQRPHIYPAGMVSPGLIHGMRISSSPEALRKANEGQQHGGRESKTGPNAGKEEQLMKQQLKMETCPYLWRICFSKWETVMMLRLSPEMNTIWEKMSNPKGPIFFPHDWTKPSFVPVLIYLLRKSFFIPRSWATLLARWGSWPQKSSPSEAFWYNDVYWEIYQLHAEWNKCIDTIYGIVINLNPPYSPLCFRTRN